MLVWVLAFMTAISPHTPRRQLLPFARAIRHAVRTGHGTQTDAAVLAVIALHENGLRVGNGVPFGVTDAYRLHGRPVLRMERAASHALRIVRRGRQRCRTRDAAVYLGYFHSGRCRSDGFSELEVRSLRRGMAAIGRERR